MAGRTKKKGKPGLKELLISILLLMLILQHQSIAKTLTTLRNQKVKSNG